MQAWQNEGFAMYAKRIPAKIILNESLPTSKQNLKTHKGYTIALDRQGQALNSIEIAKKIETLQHNTNHFVFMIGDADGLSPEEIKLADEIWSLSPLTFPHQLTKIILIEQLYRAFMILSNHPYHK